MAGLWPYARAWASSTSGRITSPIWLNTLGSTVGGRTCLTVANTSSLTTNKKSKINKSKNQKIKKSKIKKNQKSKKKKSKKSKIKKIKKIKNQKIHTTYTSSFWVSEGGPRLHLPYRSHLRKIKNNVEPQHLYKLSCSEKHFYLHSRCTTVPAIPAKVGTERTIFGWGFSTFQAAATAQIITAK